MTTNRDENPQPGDMIEIFRGTYQHWALYVGDGLVVHLVRPAGPNGSGSRHTAEVRKEDLCEVAGNDYYRVNNNLDHKCRPRPLDVIVKEALAQVGKVLPYNVVSANCEHFVTKLRYGKSVSRQVRSYMFLPGFYFLGPLGWVTAGVIALSTLGRSSRCHRKTRPPCNSL